MFSALDIERCPQCNGLTRPVVSGGIGKGNNCIQHCKVHCEYIFHYIPQQDRLSVEKFIFKEGKLYVNHILKNTEYYALQGSPGQMSFKLVKTSPGVITVTPSTALNILKKTLNALLIM